MSDRLVELLRTFAPAAWDTMVEWRDLSVAALAGLFIVSVYVAWGALDR